MSGTGSGDAHQDAVHAATQHAGDFASKLTQQLFATTDTILSGKYDLAKLTSDVGQAWTGLFGEAVQCLKLAGDVATTYPGPKGSAASGTQTTPAPPTP